MSVSRESPQPCTPQPYPDPELLSCRAPGVSPVGEKLGKRDCGTSKLDTKHYRISGRLSNDPWPLRTTCHAETGVRKNLDFPFFSSCTLFATGECSWLELKAGPPLLPGHHCGPSRTQGSDGVATQISSVVQLLGA